MVNNNPDYLEITYKLQFTMASTYKQFVLGYVCMLWELVKVMLLLFQLLMTRGTISGFLFCVL